MKKLNLVMFAVLVFLSIQVNAQTRYDDDKKSTITENLWFGTAFGGLGLTNNSFGFGTSPMVGYKLLEGSSVGIRIPIDYYYIKATSNGQSIIHNDWDLGIGAFARQKLFFNVFAHAEVNHLVIDDLVTANGFLLLDPNDNTRFLTERYNKQEANVGLGYSSGNSGLAYEVSVMYDFLADRTEPFAPILLRAGLNYKF